MKRTKLDELMKEIGVTNTGLAAITGLHRKTIQEAIKDIIEIFKSLKREEKEDCLTKLLNMGL